jgi:drug/metabolite transporter (DMT)-like permease
MEATHTLAKSSDARHSDKKAARRAPWLLVICAVLWSTSGLVVKLVPWQPLSILCLRSAIAALVLLAFLTFNRRSGNPLAPSLFGRLSVLELLGAACYLATQIAFVTATKLTTAANAIFLQYTAPLYVLLFGWLFLHERPRRADWLTMPLIFAGLLLFLGEDLTLQGATGNVLGIISGATLAGMMICTRGQSGLPIRTFLIGMLAGTLIGLPSLLGETVTFPDVALVTYLGVFQMGVALVFYSLGILHVPALEATLILALEPVLNPVWVFLVIGEKPSPWALLGGALVLMAVILRAVVGAREAR